MGNIKLAILKGNKITEVEVEGLGTIGVKHFSVIEKHEIDELKMSIVDYTFKKDVNGKVSYKEEDIIVTPDLTKAASVEFKVKVKAIESCIRLINEDGSYDKLNKNDVIDLTEDIFNILHKVVSDHTEYDKTEEDSELIEEVKDFRTK